jgi:hypothetical protein
VDRAGIGEGTDHLDDGVLEPIGVTGRGLDPLGAHDRAELVDHCSRDLRAADVDADRMHG